MTNSNPNPDECIAHNRNGIRPAHVRPGEDTGGAFHVSRPTDLTIHVLQDGERVEKFVLGARSPDYLVTVPRKEVDSPELLKPRHIADDEDPVAPVHGQLANATEVAA